MTLSDRKSLMTPDAGGTKSRVPYPIASVTQTVLETANTGEFSYFGWLMILLYTGFEFF